MVFCFALYGCETSAPEVHGQSKDAVSGGITDTVYEAQFPASVKLEQKGASGTLVAPQWVMSAEHAFDEEWELNTMWSWHVGAGPGGVLIADPLDDCTTPGPRRCRSFKHTKLKSGPVQIFGHNDYRDTDMALVRLDRPVRHPIGAPAPMPGASECGSSFSGRLVGFADGGYNENGYNCADEVTSPRRRFGPADLSWLRTDNGLSIGSTFERYFEAPANQGCTGLTGIGVGGDSGGSLYKSDGMLCGVISGDGPLHSGGSPSTTVWSDYHTAAVDDPAAVDWWSAYIYDVDGALEGSCPIATEYSDPDNDGIASTCDTCPTVYNPDQLTTISDDDVDDVGNACDLCEENAVDPVDQVANRNLEIEFALAYPRDEQLPVLDRSDFATEQDFTDATKKYTQAFFPDKCDPMPVPVATLRRGGSLPPGTSLPTPDLLDPVCVTHTQGCETILNNVLDLKVFSSPEIDAAQSVDPISLDVGMRWCDCQGVQGASPQGFNGRTACRLNAFARCSFDESFYDDLGADHRWQRIRTRPLNESWAQATSGDEFTLPISGTTSLSVEWDFPSLGSNHLITEDNRLSVKGMLWIHSRALVGQGQGGPSVPGIDGADGRSLKKYGNSLVNGEASWAYRPAGHLWVTINEWIECPMCGLNGATLPLFEVGNPEWALGIPDGITSLSPPSAATVAFCSSTK